MCFFVNKKDNNNFHLKIRAFSSYPDNAHYYKLSHINRKFSAECRGFMFIRGEIKGKSAEFCDKTVVIPHWIYTNIYLGLQCLKACFARCCLKIFFPKEFKVCV